MKDNVDEIKGPGYPISPPVIGTLLEQDLLSSHNNDSAVVTPSILI